MNIITKKRYKTSRNKTKKSQTMKTRNKNTLLIPSSTPIKILKLSNKINKSLKQSSYSPTINKQLITLKSIERQDLLDCNTENAFKMIEPLKIRIPKTGKCYYYYAKEARSFLLKNLAANKHINPDKIIPPIQSQSNCWFNSMFVTFFVSDKGRKFFHFLRQLMIEGKQKNGKRIPEMLRDAFALLNFGIDSCLTGNEFAYKLNTNNIIHLINKSIPDSYKAKYPYIPDVDEAGNPVLYYTSIINYLNNNSIQVLFLRDLKNEWDDILMNSIEDLTHMPHIIILEIYDENAEQTNKPTTINLKNHKYEIDSAVIRDISKQHFCSTLICEKKEMGYDGASFHRLVKMKWKNNINKDIDWEFEGTKNSDGFPLKWNFKKCYQLLMYYRVS